MSARVGALDMHLVSMGESLGIAWVTSSWSPEGCPVSAWVGAKEHPGYVRGGVRVLPRHVLTTLEASSRRIPRTCVGAVQGHTGRCLGLPMGSMSREQLGIKRNNQTISR